jgi:hypothetical protein
MAYTPSMNQAPFPLLTRRQALSRFGAGFGTVGLAGALAQGCLHAAAPSHHAPKAKRVIFLFMNGGPSHVDTFDPKPALAKHEGEAPADTGRKTKSTGYMPSPFAFSQYGQSGLVMSELFPNLSRHADDLCVIRSMHTDQPNHEPGLLIMQSGHPQPVRPSMGSWVSYGLGSENRNLPSYVALSPGRPVVGPQLWSNGFLPGEHQATAVNTSNMAIDKLIANLRHPHLSREEQRVQLDLVNTLNQIHLEKRQQEAKLDAQIRAMELAYAMQAEASEVFDISSEPASVRERYGKTNYADSCILARRLSEAGVRFVQIFYTDGGKQPWDTHSNNNSGHQRLCADSDKATAALLDDLKDRGLLDETLVVWGGEFGRTPYSQAKDKDNDPMKLGRDHHHTGFSMLLAGGGIHGGLMYGSTDEFGMHAIENRVHVHDLHATILHLLGIDHERLTYHYSGRDFRLTDLYGTIVEAIMA